MGVLQFTQDDSAQAHAYGHGSYLQAGCLPTELIPYRKLQKPRQEKVLSCKYGFLVPGGRFMTDETHMPAARSLLRTAITVGAVMSAAALITVVFALQTVANRRGHDLRPGAFDPLLSHLKTDTVMACGWTGPIPAALAGGFAKTWQKTAGDPGAPPWCFSVSANGFASTVHHVHAVAQSNPPFLARLVASRRGSQALFWIVAAANQPDAHVWLEQLGFPRSAHPGLTNQISQNAWVAWIEPENAHWVVRCVVRPTDEATVRTLAATAETSAPVGLRHLRDGGDIVLGWNLSTAME